MYASARGTLRIKIDDVTVAQDTREVMAGTVDLDHADEPDIVTGAYEYGGQADGGYAKQKVAGDGTNPAEAQLDVAVNLLKTAKLGLNLKVYIRSFALVQVRVPTSHGWGQALVKHNSYPPPDHTGKYAGFSGTGNQDWSVIVVAWDLDDPSKEILIKTFSWINWGDA